MFFASHGDYKTMIQIGWRTMFITACRFEEGAFAVVF
jgi:hypothetical protein